MEAGDRVYTPRFCTVTIEKVFKDRADASKEGYSESTYYRDGGYTVLGKSLDMYHMMFAGVKIKE